MSYEAGQSGVDGAFNVKGLSDLQKMLDTLPVKIEQNIMRGAFRVGGRVIRDRARAICPIESPTTTDKYKTSLGWTPGELRRSIRSDARLRGGMVIASIKAGNKKAYYAHMVEWGTQSHWIRPKGAKSLFFSGMFSELIKHPGSRRNRFMTITLDSCGPAAADAVAAYIRARLTKEGIEMPDDGGAGQQ